jgi:hypothetical protein
MGQVAIPRTPEGSHPKRSEPKAYPGWLLVRQDQHTTITTNRHNRQTHPYRVGVSVCCL